MANIYFKDPRFQFPIAVEFVFRLVIYVWYTVFAVGTFLLFFSHNSHFVPLAILFAGLRPRGRR